MASSASYSPSVASVDNDIDAASLRHETATTASVSNETEVAGIEHHATINGEEEEQAADVPTQETTDTASLEEGDPEANAPEDSVVDASIVPVSSSSEHALGRDDTDTVERHQTKKKTRWALIAVTLLAVIVASVVSAVVLTRNHKTPQEESPPQIQQPSPPLDSQYLQEIRSILVPSSLWTDTNAPQLRATEFMAYSSQRIDVSSPRLYQRYALLTLYFSSGGETSWPFDPARHECEWPVIICNDEQQVVLVQMGTQLDLTGRLVDEIGLLSNLTHLHLEQNRLEGTLPESLFDLTHLQSLRLSSNQFTSTLESAFSKLTNLHTLHVNDNFFKGTLPLSFTTLTNLQHIRLDANMFSGSISHLVPSWPRLGM